MSFYLGFRNILGLETSISHAGCPDNARGFNAIFEQAQRQLRSVFGMEMAELRGKQKGAEEGAQVGKTRASNTNGDEGNATQASKKSESGS